MLAQPNDLSIDVAISANAEAPFNAPATGKKHR
jgi:hypothetical protein